MFEIHQAKCMGDFMSIFMSTFLLYMIERKVKHTEKNATLKGR